MDIQKEFERQCDTLVQKKYPEGASLSEKEFLAHIEPLREKLELLPSRDVDLDSGYIPFVIVVKHTLVSMDTAMSLVEKDGKAGITKLFPHTSNDFQAIEGEQIPDTVAYLLVDIDRGKENRNIAPSEAMDIIREKDRHPLTIDEGVAIVTQFPDFLMKNNCFSLLASRHQGDKRVPAIWINAHKNPNLGWCWDGNPHTWLGSASCERRI